MIIKKQYRFLHRFNGSRIINFLRVIIRVIIIVFQCFEFGQLYPQRLTPISSTKNNRICTHNHNFFVWYVFQVREDFEHTHTHRECLFRSFNVVAAWPQIKCWSTFPCGSVAAWPQPLKIPNIYFY